MQICNCKAQCNTILLPRQPNMLPLLLQATRTHTHMLISRLFSSYPLPPTSTVLLDTLRVLCTRGQIHEALSLFFSTPSPNSSHIYSTLFHACARDGLLEQGMALHQRLSSECYPPDLFTTNHLINMYAKCGLLDLARQLFDEMPRRNIFTWSVLMSGYAQCGFKEECFRLFKDMLVEYRPTEFAFASVLSASREESGRQVHAITLKVCYDSFLYVANALITMYCRSFGGENEGWKVFEGMGFRNLISWNSMIAGFHGCKVVDRALMLFSQMHSEGIGFDRATLLSVLSSVSERNESAIELGLQYCCQMHSLTIRTGFVADVEVVTALIKCYSNCGGDVADCYKLFLQTNLSSDVVLWTGIITAFAEKDPVEAVFLFRRLLQEDLAPDRYTFSIVLKAAAGLATERHAMSIHSQIIRNGFMDDIVLANALIHAYGRCGSIALSKQIFDEMEVRDTVSWNSMLKTYALHGRGKESLNIFSNMSAPPDATTFVALLTACSYAGMVEEGIKFFDSMVENHGIDPQLDHYACMVDILGRAGRISEAVKLIRKMPIEPDPVIWSSLLGACRKHGHTSLAQSAATKLQELEPENSLGYVQLSNIYSLGKSFNEASLIRKNMKMHSVVKEPGLSWIEFGNQVHEFASGGCRHPQREAIYAKLEEMINQLKEKGYIPETNCALQDIEYEHKEEQLFFHSEKLALVFAVMNASNLYSGAIKIMKNIRICVDCHNFMKMASDFVQREIVVRDSNRFHHFNDGACSCKDFW